MRSWTFKSVATALLVAIVCTTGCNTVRGVGKDVEKGGEKIQSTATKLQK